MREVAGHHGGHCPDTEQVTCGNCGLQWCGKHDPCPSALCPACNGRGYTTAPWVAGIDAPHEYRIEVEEVVKRTYTVNAVSADYAMAQADDLDDDEYDTRTVERRCAVAWRKESLYG